MYRKIKYKCKSFIAEASGQGENFQVMDQLKKILKKCHFWKRQKNTFVNFENFSHQLFFSIL